MILAAALIMGGTIAGSVQAQKHLDALVKRCESMDKVSVDVIINKNKQTKQLERSITTISFSSKENPQLLKDFVEAFKADQDEAYKVGNKSVNGKVYPSFYRFDKGKTDILYSVDMDANKYYGTNDVSISRIERVSTDNDTSYNMSNSNGVFFDGGKFNQQMAEYNQKMADYNKQMNEYNKKMTIYNKQKESFNEEKRNMNDKAINIERDTIQWADSTVRDNTHSIAPVEQ